MVNNCRHRKERRIPFSSLILGVFLCLPSSFAVSQVAKSAFKPQDATYDTVLYGTANDPTQSIAYLIDKLEENSPRSSLCTIGNGSINFANPRDQLPLSITVNASGEVLLIDKQYSDSANASTSQLYQTLYSLMEALSADSDCLYAAYTHWQNRAYKRMSVLEIHFSDQTVVLKSLYNGPDSMERLYELDLIDSQDFMLKSLLTEGDVGFENQESLKLKN